MLIRETKPRAMIGGRAGERTPLHANIQALSAVLSNTRRNCINRLVCLGDIVGYDASPNECSRPSERPARAQSRESRPGGDWREGFSTIRTRCTPSHRVDERARAVPGKHPLPAGPTRGHARRRPILRSARRTSPRAERRPPPLHATSDRKELRRAHRRSHSGSRTCFFGHTHHPVAYEQRGSSLRRIVHRPRRTGVRLPRQSGQRRTATRRQSSCRHTRFSTPTSAQSRGSASPTTLPQPGASGSRRAGLVVDPFLRRSVARLRGDDRRQSGRALIDASTPPSKARTAGIRERRVRRSCGRAWERKSSRAPLSPRSSTTSSVTSSGRRLPTVPSNFSRIAR